MVRRWLIAAMIVAGFCQVGNADILNIEDGTASFQYDTDNAGFDNFSDTNGGDNLFRESWFLRRGGITTELTGGTAAGGGSDSGSIDFGEVLADVVTGDGLDVSVSYQIVENGDLAILNYQLSITNNLVSTETVSAFQYFDHDVLTGATNDIAFDGTSDPTILISGTDGSGGNAVVRRAGVGATGFQIGLFADDIPNVITTGGNLDNSTAETTSADVAGAFQWDFSIGGGQTVIISGSAVTAIPEPSTAMLGLLLLGGFYLRRKP